MALTPEQEAKLLKDAETNAAAIAQLTPLVAEVGTLKTTLAAKDVQIAELQKHSQTNLNSTALNELKSAYPDVPEASLSVALELPAEKRVGLLKPLQDQATLLKAERAKSNPMSGWEDAGSISPSTDAERQATQADRQKRYGEHQKSGNLFGMLEERGAEIAAHVRRALTPAAR